MLKSNFLLNFRFFKIHSKQLTQRICLDVLPVLFLEAQALCNATQKIYLSNRKAREITLFLTGPKLPASFVSCNFIHYIFRKVFCNILIQKFQNSSTRTGCLALYISLFQNNYWRKKYFIFCFCDLCQTSTFQIISKHALSRSFLDRCVIL